jgi:predicted transcriptional regulator
MSLVEIAAQIVSANASSKRMSIDEIIADLAKVHRKLSELERGEESHFPEEPKPAVSTKDAFKKNEVICLVCGKGGFKTLARHLTTAHGMKAGAYRRQFGIPTSQPLSAKSYSELRKKMAADSGLADRLTKAREVRAAKTAEKKAPRRGKTVNTGAESKGAAPGKAASPGRPKKRT